MARITLANLALEITDHTPSKSTAKIARAANRALREIYREIPVSTRGVLVLVPAYSTGTLDIAQDALSATGTGTTWTSSYVGGLIKIEGDDTWYTVDTVGGTANLDIVEAFQGAGGTGLTYTLVQPYVTLPATIGSIQRAWIAGQHEIKQAANELRSDVFGQTKIQTPYWFAYRGYGTDGRRKVEFIYWPDARYTVTYIGRESPTLFDASDTGSVTTLPPEWEDMLIANTLYYVFMAEHKAEDARSWRITFKDTLSQCKSEAIRNFEGQLESYYRDDTVVFHEPVT